MSSLKHRLAKSRGETLEQSVKAPPIKEISYLSFVRSLPCVVTGQAAEAAHLSSQNKAYGHYGRGKGQKASDCWALPLTRREHVKQHKINELKYWAQVGINPHALARALYGTYCERGSRDALTICINIIKTAKEL